MWPGNLKMMTRIKEVTALAEEIVAAHILRQTARHFFILFIFVHIEQKHKDQCT